MTSKTTGPSKQASGKLATGPLTPKPANVAGKLTETAIRQVLPYGLGSATSGLTTEEVMAKLKDREVDGTRQQLKSMLEVMKGRKEVNYNRVPGADGVDETRWVKR